MDNKAILGNQLALEVGTKSGAKSNQGAINRIRARVIGVEKSLDKSKQNPSEAIVDEPEHTLGHKGQIVEPPFDLLTLALLPEHNAELFQCVEAMEINIDGFGHRYVPRVDLNNTEVPEKLATSVSKEKTKLINFFEYATKESFISFRRKLRKDLESTGNAYFEVVRNAKGKVQGFTHLPGYQMELSKTEDDPVLVDKKFLELMDDGSVRVSTMKVWERFRRFLQSRTIRSRHLSVSGSVKHRWFKAFGDPRVYNGKTGDLVKDADKLAKMTEPEKANEVVHLSLYATRTPYGLPRYIGNLLSIFGDRAAEEINFITFRNNNIPSMVVMVSNGQLTEGTIERLESFVESQIQGSDNYSKFLILEAEGLMEGEDGSQIKMDIKPLVKEQHKDALFQVYSANNRDQVRRAFRLPPIFVGRSDDYNRATAESSRRLADEQVFAPERDEFDEMINRILFPEMGIVYHRFRSNSPNTTDNTELVKILAGAEKTGGMTPRVARAMLEDILGKELPPLPDDFAADVPFSLTMAEAVKNMAEAAEPGQQVTALKSMLGALYGDDTPDLGGDVLVDHLMSINKKLERKWTTKVQAVEDRLDEVDSSSD